MNVAKINQYPKVIRKVFRIDDLGFINGRLYQHQANSVIQTISDESSFGDSPAFDLGHACVKRKGVFVPISGLSPYDLRHPLVHGQYFA